MEVINFLVYLVPIKTPNYFLLISTSNHHFIHLIQIKSPLYLGQFLDEFSATSTPVQAP